MSYGYIAALEKFENSTYRAYFNNQPYHVPPVALNLITTALLGSDYTLAISNHPLPLNEIDESKNIGSAQSEGFNIGFTVAFG
jgi:ATP-binding cassette subfamily A (ABC1) protein 3